MSVQILTDIFDDWLRTHLLSFTLYQPSVNDLAVAVSGGPDSMALLDVMIHYAKKYKANLHVLSVDHGLRDDARQECDMVSQYIKSKNLENISHHILTWDADKPQAAIMENARVARYDLMAKYCKDHNIQLLFIGHHQDDQVETFLIRLAKGSGLDGLAAMKPLQEYDHDLTLARPFLQTPKSDLVNYCDQNDVPYVCDPSNENEKYLRPRLRASMDILSAEGLTPKRLSMTAMRLARARQALEDIADNAYQACIIEKNDHFISFDFTALKSCPLEIIFRVIATALEGYRHDASYKVRMEKLEDLVNDLIHTENFKPRTLGGCRFALIQKEKNILEIKKEIGHQK